MLIGERPSVLTDAERESFLIVRCVFCRAEIGEVCRNAITDAPRLDALGKRLPHAIRIQAYRELVRTAR
jgi:hypothetical protein